MDKNIIKNKSYDFALRIIKLYKYLKLDKNEYVLANQILRSGTSIGANIEEAIGGQSKKDFFAKICISYKECRETEYWLRLLHDSEFIETKHFNSIHEDCKELLNLLSSIKISTQKTLK